MEIEKEQCTVWGQHQLQEKPTQAYCPWAVQLMGDAPLLSLYISSMSWWNCKHVSWKQVALLASIPVCVCAYSLPPCICMCAYLFFHWDFINGVLFLFVALLIQKLDSDPDKHDLFLAKQRANAKALDQDSRKIKMLPVLKKKFMFHISLNLMLFWCLYT